MADGSLSSAEVLDRAVFALELAAHAHVPDLALSTIRAGLQDLDSVDVARVAACLALQAVRGRAPAEVAAWLETLTLEHLALLDAPPGAGSGG
ncbi:hypothetical protein ACIBCT_38760 [Streptosporangium sp. NPDC050855]|uniref:hypothetical protein n=1 Tax=Streptosporangium sp. NPDC050855 TaxID=3366194 RepID=UPI0037A7C095